MNTGRAEWVADRQPGLNEEILVDVSPRPGKEEIMQYLRRIEDFQAAMADQGLAGAVLFHSRDILYYTGTAQPSLLVVLPDDCRLFVRRGYEFALSECALEPERVVAAKNLESIVPGMFPGAGSGERIGTELDLLTVPLFRSLCSALGERELVDVSPQIMSRRMIKDRHEIACVEEACRAVHAGHESLCAGFQAGMSELEAAAIVEHGQRLAGHEGVFFVRATDFFMSRGPVASGPTWRRISGAVYTITGEGLSRAVPAGPSRRAMNSGDCLLIDIPACIEGYHADQSRTYAIGKAGDRALELHGMLREIADHALQAMSMGVTCGEIFAQTSAKAAALGLEDAFMNFGAGARAHFIGHGIGLELNEPPILARNSRACLAEGMTIALELHLMEPDGLAMKLEDTVEITSAGPRLLTLSPRELTCLGRE